MRLLIISDIHANLAAFQAVLDQTKGKWDKIWFLGDLVGYGPDPNECVELLRQQDHIALSGNHDWAVLGKLDIEAFNDDAQRAIRWTQKVLTQENHDYLNALSATQIIDPFTLVHASPRGPIWEYILDLETATENFDHFHTPLCLSGHTHVPIVFENGSDGVDYYLPVYDYPLDLKGSRLIINPGSVGQPRDSDPRAAYSLLDLPAMTWKFHRVAYDIAQTQQRMKRHKLPQRLISRLEYGW